MQYFFQLGTHPELSIAEIEAVFGRAERGFTPLSRVVGENGYYFITPTNTSAEKARADFSLLGGSIRFGEILGGARNEDEVIAMIANALSEAERPLFCVNVVGASNRASARLQKHVGINVKKRLREEGIPSRWVTSKEQVSSSVVVGKEKVLTKGGDFFVFLNGNTTRVGRTIATQAFEQWSHLDYGRPARDAKSGMLPPKLARMMVNIGRVPLTVLGDAAGAEEILYDPFCGSGTVLQEAIRVGVGRVVGSDISEKAVADTTQNLAWLRVQAVVGNWPDVEIFQADALQRNTVRVPDAFVDSIVAETYLGPSRFREADIANILRDLEATYNKALPILARLLKKGGRMVLVLPIYVEGKDRLHLRLDAGVANARLHVAKKFTYGRKDQRVEREIVVMEHDA